MPVAAPVVISAVKTGTAPTNEQLVAALATLHQDHGAAIGQPRILFTSGTPSQVKVEQVWGFTLDDPTGVVLTSFSVANLQRQLQTAFPGWQVKQARLATPADLQQTSTTTIPFLVHTETSTTLQSDAPSATLIQAGFERYTRSPIAENGRWVGPAPRVVRQSTTGNNRTFAAWVYEWPDTPWVRANLSALKETLVNAVSRGLAETTLSRGGITGNVQRLTWPVVATAFSPAVNGPISWWREGNAAHESRTTTEFPGVGSTEYVENPVGPDSAATHPQDAAGNALSAVKTVGGLALALVGAVTLGPAIGSWLKRRPAAPKTLVYRRNPISFTRAAMLRTGERVMRGPLNGTVAPGNRVVKVDGVDSIKVQFPDGTIYVPISELCLPTEEWCTRPRANPSLDVANTILSQMGGAGRLKAMIGAKDFMGGENSLTFKWAAPSPANALTVTLHTDDTYSMTFMKIRGRTVKVVRAVEGAHAEDLARIFRIETGLALSL